MSLTVMSPAEGHGELVADLTAECRELRKSQVMGIGRTPAADEASLLGNRFDMIAIANAALCR